MKVLVLGATGKTGKQIVREAAGRGYKVVALVRSKARASDLAIADLADLVEGDARDPAALTRALAGCDAVISSLGTGVSPFREVTILSVATKALVEAMAGTGVHRLVCITGVGAGDSRGHGGFFYDRIFQPLLLSNVYKDKDRQEAVIRSSSLDWVIVRPVVLNDKPPRGRVNAVTDLSNVHGGQIARSDVAAFVVDQLTNDTWIGQTPLISW